jgi:hypothetical protein
MPLSGKPTIGCGLPAGENLRPRLLPSALLGLLLEFLFTDGEGPEIAGGGELFLRIGVFVAPPGFPPRKARFASSVFLFTTGFLFTAGDGSLTIGGADELFLGGGVNPWFRGVSLRIARSDFGELSEGI